MTFDVDTCFRAHRTRVYGWAYAMCGQHDDAADVVQEVFLRMVRRPPPLTNAAATVAWLRRATARIVIDRWRSRTARTASERNAPPRVASEETPEARERTRQVREALASLSEQQRLVLMGKCYDRMTFQQIADELDIAVPTAKTHYLRGLVAVRDRLKTDVEVGRVP